MLEYCHVLLSSGGNFWNMYLYVFTSWTCWTGIAVRARGSVILQDHQGICGLLGAKELICFGIPSSWRVFILNVFKPENYNWDTLLEWKFYSKIFNSAISKSQSYFPWFLLNVLCAYALKSFDFQVEVCHWFSSWSSYKKMYTDVVMV